MSREREHEGDTRQPSRRRVLAGGSALGLATWMSGGQAASAQAPSGENGIAAGAAESCEALLDLSYTADERAQIVATIDGQLDAIRRLRAVRLGNSEAPALTFDPNLPGESYPPQSSGVRNALDERATSPSDAEDLAFAPLARQAYWLRSGQISSRELTETYLERIAHFDPLLNAFVTVTSDLALAQADRADEERASGRDRGPLHGIPFGVKDLVDTANIRTSWGATPFKDRVPSANAWIIDRLADAGAVLLGKTSTGALAYGDLWFGNRTRNPWNPNEGSSGSSAGSAAAIAAGLCSFALGTETMGSVVTPASRCGTVGLRPSFGRVPRTGTMPLCWSLDKIGPLTRSVADTALVLEAINGRDAGDPSAHGHGFAWDAARDVEGMRIGYMPAWFEAAAEADRAALAVLREMSVELVELSPPDLPHRALFHALEIEAAAAFQDLTLSDRDDELTWQGEMAWPNIWRRVHFYSAVDYVQLDRFRRRAMRIVHRLMRGVDAIVSPDFGDPLLLITTFTGQPCLTLRAGFSELATRPSSDGMPEPVVESAPTRSVPENMMLWGPLFEERNLLTLGAALERRFGVAAHRPPLERWSEEARNAG